MPFASSSADAYFDGNTYAWSAPIRLFNRFCDRVVVGFSDLYWHVKLEGDPSFPVLSKPACPGRIYVANHASMLDPAYIIGYAGCKGVNIRALYKSEFSTNAFITWFFSRTGSIPIRRDTADTKAIKRAVKALKRGEDILIFPEGTRIWDPYARPEIHGGFSLIAQLASCDIVPVAIDGSELINPEKKYRIPRPAYVRIHIGDPISLKDIEGSSRKEISQNLETLVMNTIYEMRSRLRGETQSS